VTRGFGAPSEHPDVAEKEIVGDDSPALVMVFEPEQP